MARAGQRDDALFSGVSVDDQALELRRDDFIIFREEENGRHANGPGVGDAVQIGWKFFRHRSGKEPQVPPAELAQDDLPQGRRVVQDQARDFSMRGDMQRGGRPQARAKDNDGAIARGAV